MVLSHMSRTGSAIRFSAPVRRRWLEYQQGGGASLWRHTLGQGTHAAAIPVCGGTRHGSGGWLCCPFVFRRRIVIFTPSGYIYFLSSRFNGRCYFNQSIKVSMPSSLYSFHDQMVKPAYFSLFWVFFVSLSQLLLERHTTDAICNFAIITTRFQNFHSLDFPPWKSHPIYIHWGAGIRPFSPQVNTTPCTFGPQASHTVARNPLPRPVTGLSFLLNQRKVLVPVKLSYLKVKEIN